MGLKEKLVTIFCSVLGVEPDFSNAEAMEFVEGLIAHGVTVQECKIGDKIYQTDGVRIHESTIGEITLTAKHTIFVTENIAFDERAIGKSIFLSYGEAEAHLPQPLKGE